MNIKKWIVKNTRSLSGKTVAITGSTGGLGRELCRYFAMLGASLILVDRNTDKSWGVANELKSEFPELTVSCIMADMSDMESVKLAEKSLSQMSVDFLVLNAGAYSIPRCKTDIGYDNVFTINFISPYYLARKLLPGIEERGGKIVAVSSIAHNYSKIDERDVDFSTRNQASLVYGNAKRYLTYSLLALDSNAVSITHPGISFTGITNHYPKLIFALIKHPMKIIFPSPKRASISILAGVFNESKNGEWIGPKLFDIWGLPRRKSLRTASDQEIEKIAEIAEKIYNYVNR